ncbi:MAG: GNAT family N-acetyltransferase [Deltaproteobacteria bacterium]|nr:GNAT family N-acetyltransferase [Deltaproteobacteria bacterium]
MLNPISYRRLFTLSNGQKVKCRLLNGQDQDGLLCLYQTAPPEDTYFLKQDVKDMVSLENYSDQPTPRRIFLSALEMTQGRFIATAQMERGIGCSKHIGEILHIFVARPFHNLGLGSLLLGELIDLSQAEKLHWLRAEIVSEHKAALKGFLRKGFKIRATLEDFFIGRDGATYDVVLLTRSLLKDYGDDI